ncbi:MAG: HupE/UreJ family protein [Flavobacteriia bacterium]|nr:HupE/UreJ family protein [Flavobacteriia bacterium]
MEILKFYLEMGLEHVLDPNGYDHVLFLAALVLPFTLKKIPQAVYLASVFTLTHCISLALSAFGIATVNPSLIEFLIPLSILLLLGINIKNALQHQGPKTGFMAYGSTALFGLIHGFGFSNYFKILVAGQESKTNALLGFALGIELAQLCVLVCVMLGSALLISIFKIQRPRWVMVLSGVLCLITLPLAYKSFLALLGAL